MPYSLPVKYDPSVEDSRDLAAHRELILSSFTAQEAPPFVIRRPLCLAMNARTAAMVAGRGFATAPPPMEIHAGGFLSEIKEFLDGTDP